jgi:eukaryotic-like serine/threonine-protein kinase
MAIVSSGALIDALCQYQLLPAEQLRQVPHLAKGRCAEARGLAKLLGQRGWLTIYQINQLLAGRGKDLVMGPYRIVDRLGQGGLSQVFKARHMHYDWVVALKVIRPEAMADTEGGQQFLHEMEAMARLDHANIVQFCDLDQAGELFYFAMEFVEGTDLSKHVALSGPLPVVEACTYVRQAALGLQHAHERNLVHRDIKPVNLLLTHVLVPARSSRRDDKKVKEVKLPLIKILDWGLAGLRYPKGQSSPELMHSMAKGIVGTADYLSPEQARNHHTVDIRGDIYSLGCSFYFLLTGQAPFPTGSLMQKILQHQQGEPAPLNSFREDVPEDVSALLKRMLAKNPDERFQTPAAVALALAPFTRDAPAGLERLCRKITQFTGGGPRRAKDTTPLPGALGGGGRVLKAGRHRSPGREADTSCP